MANEIGEKTRGREGGELEAREYVCLVLENVEYNSINKRIGGSRQERYEDSTLTALMIQPLHRQSVETSTRLDRRKGAGRGEIEIARKDQTSEREREREREREMKDMHVKQRPW